VLLNFDDIWVHGADVLRVVEDERPLWVESKGNDILDIIPRHVECFFPSLAFIKQVFLIISDLYDKGYIENSL